MLQVHTIVAKLIESELNQNNMKCRGTKLVKAARVCIIVGHTLLEKKNLIVGPELTV